MTIALNEITFPVFALRSFEKIFKEDNKIFVIGTIVNEALILDDLSYDLPFPRRRLQIPENVKYKINKSYMNISQFLKTKTCKRTFIDNTGLIFKYTKTKIVKLTYHKILQAIRNEEIGIILIIQNIDIPLTVSSLEPIKEYVGLLHYCGGYIIYEYTSEKKKDTWRKV